MSTLRGKKHDYTSQCEKGWVRPTNDSNYPICAFIPEEPPESISEYISCTRSPMTASGKPPSGGRCSSPPSTMFWSHKFIVMGIDVKRVSAALLSASCPRLQSWGSLRRAGAPAPDQCSTCPYSRRHPAPSSSARCRRAPGKSAPAGKARRWVEARPNWTSTHILRCSLRDAWAEVRVMMAGAVNPPAVWQWS